MKPAGIFLPLLFTLLFPINTSASGTLDQFYNQILGKWYVTRSQGGIAGESIYYNPLPADSVIICRLPGTDSIRIARYENSQLTGTDNFRVIWSSHFNDWLLSVSDREIYMELSEDSFTLYMTENVTTYHRIQFIGEDLYSGNIDSAATLMTGRWYLTAVGSGTLELNESPVAGDSIIVSCREASDSILYTYYHNCKPEYSDQYRLVIDSSWSLQTDALILVNNSEINRILVTVTDSIMKLKTDSIPGHYLVLSRIDTFTVTKQVPTITGVTGGARCGEGHVMLQASSSGGTIYWYSDSSATVPVATGSSYETPELSSSAVYYVDAALDGCFSKRLPVTAIISNSDTCSVTTGTGLHEKYFSVFPNPTKGKFEVQLAENIHPGQIIICNESGYVLKKLLPEHNPVHMDISDLPDGVYFLFLQDNTSVRMVKIVKNY